MEDDGPPGVPEWVVTYGDMMSLLLTFFIMLVSLSEVVAEKKYRAILESLEQYIGYQTASVSPPGTNFPVNSMAAQLEAKLGSFTNKDRGHGGVKTQSTQGPDLRVLRTREGSAHRVGKRIPFAPHDATLAEAAKLQLTAIARTLAGKPNKIEIRAHASPGPVPSDFGYQNKTVLTYHRARNVLRFLEKQGIAHGRLRITAVSDAEPLSKTGDQRSRQLDRAEVFISDAFVSEYIGPRDIPE